MKKILEVFCQTTGKGAATVTGNLTRNGRDILSSDIICDADGQAACASKYGNCDADTILESEQILREGDVFGYKYSSQTNNPETLTFTVTWQNL